MGVAVGGDAVIRVISGAGEGEVVGGPGAAIGVAVGGGAAAATGGGVGVALGATSATGAEGAAMSEGAAVGVASGSPQAASMIAPNRKIEYQVVRMAVIIAVSPFQQKCVYGVLKYSRHHFIPSSGVAEPTAESVQGPEMESDTATHAGSKTSIQCSRYSSTLPRLHQLLISNNTTGPLLGFTVPSRSLSSRPD